MKLTESEMHKNVCFLKNEKMGGKMNHNTFRECLVSWEPAVESSQMRYDVKADNISVQDCIGRLTVKKN